MSERRDGWRPGEALLGEGALSAVHQGAEVGAGERLAQGQQRLGGSVGLRDVHPAIERLDDWSHGRGVVVLERVESVACVGEVVPAESDCFERGRRLRR